MARTAVVSAILTLSLGVLLGRAVDGIARARSLADARSEAETLALVGIQPTLQTTDLTDGLPADRKAALDQAVAVATSRGEIARIKIWNRDGRVVYSDEPRLIGQKFDIDDELSEALDGEGSAHVSALAGAENALDRRLGKLLEVYMPLRFSASAKPVGAFEMYRQYAPVARASARDSRRVVTELTLALLVLWAGVLWIVAGASRRLRAHSERNRHQALHDQLTDLPNRAHFRDLVADAAAADTRCAVLLLDLDRFKEINDALGHQVGDELLCHLGARLVDAAPEGAVVARLGGDEFGVLVPEVSGEDQAHATAVELSRALADPLEIDGMSVVVSCSIGVSVSEPGAGDAVLLLRQADVAMYVSKSTREGPQVYRSELDHYTPARLVLIGDLRRAIASGELAVHYQPKASIVDGRITGVEALARWSHPTLGPIPPVDFIPLAEHTGLIGPLTDFVLAEALGAISAWRKDGYELSVAVNLSVHTLYDQGLPEKLRQLLDRFDLSPSALEVEITESTAMDRPAAATRVLNELAALGVKVAVDDFGTGHSSMAYLRQLPVTSLKIDRSFVADMDRAGGDAAIVAATISLAHSLGLDVVAEGVESTVAWAQLARLGCDQVQGYALSRPLPPAQLGAWLKARDGVSAGLFAT